MSSLYRMCSLLTSVPPRYRYLYAAAASVVRVCVCVCFCVCMCACACVATHLQVSVYATSDTPPGERVYDKTTLIKPNHNPSPKKKKAFACAFAVDNPRQGGKSSRIPTPPKPQTLNPKP